MTKKRITFQDIADYTGFSKTTISRYFNNPDYLTPDNQKKISDALDKLDYHENKVARILAKGKTEFIGLILPNLYLHYYSDILDQILHTYENFHYKFLVFSSDDREETERNYMKELLAYQIEGLIVLSHTIPSRELASYHIPVVTIEREDQYTCSVNTDNYLGGVQAVQMLYDADCDIYLHINASLSEKMPSYGRILGFKDACKKYQLEHEVLGQDFGVHYETIRSHMEIFLKNIQNKYPSRRKGIFMPNDTYANILSNLLIRQYGTVPDDYCIVGFDNSPISQESIIPISTIGQQNEKIAYEAMNLLIQQIKEKKQGNSDIFQHPVHKVVPPVPIPRNTTKLRK